MINPGKHIKIRQLLAIVLLIPLFAHSQIERPVNFPLEELQAEKIHLYTDRDVYISGEDVFFRVDCFAPDKEAGTLSEVVYVELFNQSEERIIGKKLKLLNSYADNLLTIPTALRSGIYYLRAFTQYSRNFNPSATAFKVLEIINPNSPAENPRTESDKELNFYAEFDSLIKGRSNRIAFMCSEALAKSTDSVVLQTMGIDTIQHVVYLHGNAGMIEIYPADSLKHALKFFLHDSDSIRFDVRIPIRSKELYSEITQKKKTIQYKFHPDKNKMQTYYLNIVHQSGKIFLSKQFLSDHNDYSFSIPESELEAGINYFLLEDAKGDLLFSKAVYVDFEVTPINIRLDKKRYSTRQAVKVKIGIPGDTALLSVRVIKKGSGYSKLAANRNLLFNPLFYKDYIGISGSTGAEERKAMEIAMLVFNHSLKARHNELQKLLTRNHKLWLPESRGISISGFLLEKCSGNPVSNVPVIGSLLFSVPRFHIDNTADDGSFFISFYDLQDRKNLFISPLKKDQQIELLINNDFGASYPNITDAGFYPDSTNRQFYEEMYRNAQLTNKFGNHAMPDASIQMPDIYKDMAEEILLSDYIPLSSLSEVFKEIVPNARMRKENGKVILGVLDQKNNIWYDEPLVFLDNVPISDHDILEEIHPSRVEKIGVVSHTSVLGDHFIPGIIYIKTTDGKFAGLKMPGNSVFLEYQMYARGYSYNPAVYQSSDQNNDPSPDFRNCLYWEPGILVKGEADIEFFTADNISDFDIIIEGCNSHGKSFSGKSSFTVSPE